MAKRALVAGVVLAAGEGRRMGKPKALVEGADGRTWLERTLGVLLDGGCRDLYVVEGAQAESVEAAADDFLSSRRGADGEPKKITGLAFVESPDWSEGLGASLRTVLTSFLDNPASTGVDALLVMLVDLPDVGPDVVRRVLDHADTAADPRAVLARATYDGRPGHPVLVGRDHWAPMAATLSGDEGGRRYLADHGAAPIECGDLATGRDQDTPSPAPE
ncbi:nucleotidyltransferase family protein [Mumia zhuanghuii]|uniref:NTP transferase domain-containing protein n=2 Tax=Mumia TaxID=1546255 RepID=A0ABW1QFS9_9ACTN|nr:MULTISPECIES: nucleotidyltransferase family protein [Mumia]KAA1422900.1 nucleotidyltransferase family protein [Mumia zhuanghuii]